MRARFSEGNTVSEFADLLATWRKADVIARAAEDVLLTASLQALDGNGQPPTRADQENAKQLRRAADVLLEHALGKMNLRTDWRGCAGAAD